MPTIKESMDVLVEGLASVSEPRRDLDAIQSWLGFNFDPQLIGEVAFDEDGAFLDHFANMEGVEQSEEADFKATMSRVAKMAVVSLLTCHVLLVVVQNPSLMTILNHH
ncbi:hypothetical protein ABZP36_013901 [Zizania latifolia]